MGHIENHSWMVDISTTISVIKLNENRLRLLGGIKNKNVKHSYMLFTRDTTVTYGQRQAESKWKGSYKLCKH